ncbi:hypothetical protein BC939DRAFT_452250 [Gamsiella multidivaricata]|uniref:uncharacterized protein n=1 Tax=Gamsiella multidivaricata TaxID=101098 RepID=UPI00221FD4D7|nr:uncharacterized protein BC939DRAFT_452250 [Gamsiella multidivaricata]KAI7823244.1 hypothetical protein BC939DRAFT_452250 [Gamsiella multidivaricata]
MCSSSSDEKVDPIQGLKQRLILGNTKTELDKDRRRCDLTSEGESTDHPAVLAQSGMADERAIGISSQSKSPYLRTSYHLSSSPGHISMDTSRSSLSYQNSLAPLLSLSPVTPEGHIKTTPAVEDLPSTYQHTMELMRPAALNTPKDFETQQNEPTPSFLAMTESTTHSFSGGNARFSGDYQKAQECVPWPAFGPILGEHSCGADAPLEGEQGLGGSSSLDSECTHHSSSVPSSASGHPSQRSSGFVAYHQRGTTSGAVNKLRAAQADGTVVDTPQGMFLGYPLAHRSYACITSSSTESHRILTQERGVSRPPVSKEIFTEQHVSMHEHSNAFSRQWLQISPTFRSTPSSTSCIQGPQATTPGRGTSLGGPYPLNVQTLIDDHHHVERPWISGGDTRSLTRGMRKESGMSANRQESTSSAARTSVPDPNAALSQVCLHDSLMPFSSPACPSPFRDSSAVEMRLSRAQHICMPSSSCMFADTFQRSDIQESTHYRSMRGAPRQPIVQRSCEKESASSNPSGPNEQIGSSYLDVNSLYSGVPHSASSNNFQSPPLYFVGSGGSNYDVTSQQQYKSTAPSAMCRDGHYG